jgi:hypothetical protein
MALIRDVGDWPLLICGPVLRRVGPTEVTVFIATKVGCDVQLVVREAGTAASRWESDVTHTRKLGQSLHVVVSHLIPRVGKLISGVVYEYDLRMTPETGGTQTLADQAGLLSGKEPLGYTSGALPTFALPPPLADLNLLHSSCRKPHGGGPDALVMVDRLISRTLKKPAADQARLRPHHLLLTGDQIYADDVAISMLATLQEVGAVLCAQTPQETFPDRTASAAGFVTMTAPKVRPGMARQVFLKQNSTLSSDEAMNHLMFFAEFAAMYVMCWSDELWPRRPDGTLTVGPVQTDLDLFMDNRTQRKELLSFVSTVRRARRALANVPTMMIFDDHEISDDWNLDGHWLNASRSNPPQKRVVRNGLLAYAAFQAWGNDPEAFTSGVPKSLLDAVTIPAGANAPPITATPASADVALDLTVSDGERMIWDWTLDGPEHMVIALDSRTHRDFISLGMLQPGLISAKELGRQLSAFAPTNSGDTKLRFVIAPAPVLGHPFVEGTMQPLLRLFESFNNYFDRIKGGRLADNEAWCVNRIIFQSMLRRLAEFGRVVVLSGDVHYAYTNHTAYFGANGQSPARIVQLCSSAAKNADSKTRLIQEAGLVGREGESWLGLGVSPPPTVIAQLRGALGEAVMATLSPAEKNLLDRVRLFGLFDGPAVLPMSRWRSATAGAEVARLADRNDPRDWRYRTTFAFDDRDGSTRATVALDEDPLTPSAGAMHLAKHANKVVVGEPNVGQVLVHAATGTTTSVVHRIHFMTKGDDPSRAAQASTEHVVPLAPPGLDERPEPDGAP